MSVQAAGPLQGRAPNANARGVLLATLISADLIAHLVTAKAARDALFLSNFELASLPRMMIVGALSSLGAALASARVMARRSPAVLLVRTLGASAPLYAIASIINHVLPRLVAIGVYVQVSALGGALLSAFWSLINERFDPYTAKRAVARIGLGGSLGGVLGGAVSWLLSGGRGLSFLLVMLAALNLGALVGVIALTRTIPSKPLFSRKFDVEHGSATSALKTLRTSPYLTTLAMLVALSALSSVLLEYVLSRNIVAIYSSGAELARFFSLFHASVAMLALLVQLTLARRCLERFGLAGTVALLPGSVLTMGIVGLLVPALWSAVLLRGSEALVQTSLFRSGYELFYTPLPRSQKRPTKILIDVGVDRLGTVIGGGLTSLVISSLHAHSSAALILLALLASIGSLLCAGRLHRGYVAALANALRYGTLRLDQSSVFDATTRKTLAETARLNRSELLAAIERRQSEHPEDHQSTLDHEQAEPAVLAGPSGASFETAPGYVGLELGLPRAFRTSDILPSDDDLIRRVAALHSGRKQHIQQALSPPLAPELAAHVIPLLGQDEVARDALRALQSIAPQITGTLADALLDPNGSIVVRRRVPRVLQNCATARATQVLVEGLFESELEVRHRCALVLLHLSKLDPNLPVARERILDAIERELAEKPVLAPSHDEPLAAVDDDAGVVGGPQLRIGYVMTLLGLVLEREPVQLAHRALVAGEPAIRGTAIEYLENVLPARVKQGVLSLILGSARAPHRAKGRDRAELVDELLRSREVLMPRQPRSDDKGA